MNPLRSLTTTFAICGLFIADVSATARPNILFVAFDDLNTHLGNLAEESSNDLQVIYSDPIVRAKVRERLTPNLDRFMNSGAVTFTHAYTAAPVCNQSRTALMLGLHPSRTGVYRNDVHFRNVPGAAARQTLPELLRSHGYFTAGLGKIFHKPAPSEGKDWPDSEHSWDAWINRHVGANGPASTRPRPALHWITPLNVDPSETADYQNGVFTGELLRGGPATITDNAGTARTLSLPADQPFFLACGIFRPHIPWATPEQYFDLFPLDEMAIDDATIAAMEADFDDIPPEGRRKSGLSVGIVNGLTQRLKESGSDMSQAEMFRRLSQAYLASVAYADAAFGQIMAGLAEGPYADNTVVAVWSDHGWHTATKYTFDKLTLWEGGTRVVFAIRDPDHLHPAQTRSPRLVSLLDLYPSLATRAGVVPPADLDGTNINPLIAAPHRSWPAAVASTFGAGNHSLRTERFRYIRYRQGEEELYHIATDPWELTNLAYDNRFAGDKARLARALDAELTAHPNLEGADSTPSQYRLAAPRP